MVACEEFRLSLNQVLKAEHTAKNFSVCVLQVAIEDKKSIYYYSKCKRPFLRITVASPRMVPTVRRILEEGTFKFGNFPMKK